MHEDGFSFIECNGSFVCRLSSVVCRLSSAVCRLPSVVYERNLWMDQDCCASRALIRFFSASFSSDSRAT